MLLMMDWNSVVWIMVEIWEQSRRHFSERAMPNICVALNKEKGIRNILAHVHKNCLDNCSIK